MQKRVLLIEDDEDIAARVLRLLRDGGFHAVRESARIPGIARAKAEAPDVVILDLQLPSDTGRADEDIAHGLAALDELVAQDPFRPVVVCSGHGGNKELAREVYRRTRGGPLVSKDSETFDEELFTAIAAGLGRALTPGDHA